MGTCKDTLSRRGFLMGSAVATAAATVLAPVVASADEGVAAFEDSYEVVVIGFGFAGAMAAISAVEAGAEKVLIVDAAPEGEEGGNSRYCAQVATYGTDREKLLAYHRALAGEMEMDDEVLQVFVDGLFEIPDHFRRLGVADPCIWSEYMAETPAEEIPSGLMRLAKVGSPEYPGLEGGEAVTSVTAHAAVSDGAFYQAAHGTVESCENIEVWCGAPARSLVQDAKTRRVTGVVVERGGAEVRIEATHGVVLACGGFECNAGMIQDYLGFPRLVPKGGLYNNGDGIKMAQAVGADLWHMANYETFGYCGSYVYKTPVGERNVTTSFKSYAGSMICVAEDGTRFLNEENGSAWSRHGKVYDHGIYTIPTSSLHPYMVFDEAQMATLEADGALPYNLDELLVTAPDAAGLAGLIGVDPDVLTRTIERFNEAAASGFDAELGRSAESMRALEGTLYALPLEPSVLNTQGGPRRNARAQVMHVDGTPIPGLFSAGECGGITAHYYQGGSNVAECLVFGHIAGKNAMLGVD